MDYYEIHKLDINGLSQDKAQELYTLYDQIVKKYNFLRHYRSAEEYKNSFLSRFTNEGNEILVIKNNEVLSGILCFVKSADWGGNEQYELIVQISALEINSSIIKCLSDFIDSKLDKHKQIAITVFNNELDKLIKQYSYKTQLTGGFYTLRKTDIDVVFLTNAAQEYQAQNDDLCIVYSDVISEENIEPFCDLFNEFQEAMPDVKENGFVQYVETPEKLKNRIKSFADNNRTHHCYIIYNKKGEMIAMTNVSVNNNDPRFPYQFLIGVKEQYRGRNIGKWLYAAMYKKLFDDVDFEMAHVAHHHSNKPAINISEWVGYKYSYLETTYIILRV